MTAETIIEYDPGIHHKNDPLFYGYNRTLTDQEISEVKTKEDPFTKPASKFMLVGLSIMLYQIFVLLYHDHAYVAAPFIFLIALWLGAEWYKGITSTHIKVLKEIIHLQGSELQDWHDLSLSNKK